MAFICTKKRLTCQADTVFSMNPTAPESEREPSSDDTNTGEILLRDLIYFDAERAASLVSQLERGLVHEVKERIENSAQASDEIRASLGGALGATTTSSTA